MCFVFICNLQDHLHYVYGDFVLFMSCFSVVLVRLSLPWLVFEMTCNVDEDVKPLLFAHSFKSITGSWFTAADLSSSEPCKPADDDQLVTDTEAQTVSSGVCCTGYIRTWRSDKQAWPRSSSTWLIDTVSAVYTVYTPQTIPLIQMYTSVRRATAMLRNIN